MPKDNNAYTITVKDFKAATVLGTFFYAVAKTAPLPALFSIPLAALCTLVLADYCEEKGIKRRPGSNLKAVTEAAFSRSNKRTESIMSKNCLKNLRNGGAYIFDSIATDLSQRVPRIINTITSTKPKMG